MFATFFRELKQAGVPVTLREYLTLMEAIEKDLADWRIMSGRRTGCSHAGAAMLRALFAANKYPKSVKINDAQLAAASLTHDPEAAPPARAA